jgi:hypothetical protein
MRLTPKQQADAKAATNRKLKAFNAMVCDPRLNGTDIRVAWRIIDRMNVKCQSHPGHKLISEEIGCTRQTVLRSTTRLEGFGYFDIAKGGGKGKSHSYTLIRETVRDDGQYQKKPRSADSVRGLKRGCPSPSSKVVRDDGQEPTKEPFMEPIKGGPAASPPEDGSAPSKKKDGLHVHAVILPLSTGNYHVTAGRSYVGKCRRDGGLQCPVATWPRPRQICVFPSFFNRHCACG